MSNTEDLIESVRGDEAAMKRELQAAWSRLQEADAEESFDDAAFIRICADELGDPYAQLLASHMALEGIGMDPDSGAAGPGSRRPAPRTSLWLWFSSAAS